MRLGSAGIGLAQAISPTAVKYCRGQQRSGTRSSPGARCASGGCAWYGTGLMAGSISTGSH